MWSVCLENYPSSTVATGGEIDMKESDMKNIHFLVPRPLYEEFKTAFPEVGLMKILFTQFMQAAIEGAGEKDSFVRGIYRGCVESAEYEDEVYWLNQEG